MKRFDEAEEWFTKALDACIEPKKDICQTDMRLMIVEVRQFYTYHIDRHLCQENLESLEQFFRLSESEKQLGYIQHFIGLSDFQDICKIRRTFKKSLENFPLAPGFAQRQNYAPYFGQSTCFFANQFENLYLFHNSGLITDLFKFKRYRSPNRI